MNKTDKIKTDWTVSNMVNYPTNIQTGYLHTIDGKLFDISVILNFPNESDYDNLDDFPSVNLIDFYFGTPNDHDTETYVKQFVEKQKQFISLYQKLLELLTVNPDDPDLRNHIDFVKSLIVKLH